MVACGSFLSDVESTSKVDKFAGVEMTSDPAGTLPNILTAKIALAASAMAEYVGYFFVQGFIAYH